MDVTERTHVRRLARVDERSVIVQGLMQDLPLLASIDLANSLMSHPAVRDAMVVAVSHPKWQQRPAALVVPRMSGTAADVLSAYLKERFPEFRVPDAFHFVEQLPRAAMGKFDKKGVRESLDRGTLAGDYCVATVGAQKADDVNENPFRKADFAASRR
jgi:non-ribosomal peptide synthetase component E (peptide arylation enzyme)